MQKSKPIEYVQAILYHLKYKWRIIVMVILATLTVTLGLAYAATGIALMYKLGVGAGLIAVITAIVIFAPELERVMDQFGLRLVPEDEKEKATSECNR